MAYRDAESFGYGANPAYEDRAYQDRSNVGREEPEQADSHATDESWTAQRAYEYRGGRDPVTGRANTQM